MLPVRIAFDPALPVVASQTFTTGGRTFNDGDPFPWKEAGLSEAELYNFWRSGFVSFVAEQAPRPKRTRQARAAE